jgi:CheY-like chemotaxis protein
MSTVLIAEKATSDRKRLEKLLANERLNVESTADGRVLLEKIQTSMPDLVLLDVKMPQSELKLNDVLNKIREQHGRVLLVSAKSSLDTARSAFERGTAAGFLEKPVDSKKLLENVRRLLAGIHTPGTFLEVPLRELHDEKSGRIDAQKVAEFLGVPLAELVQALGASYPAVYKTPAASSLQEALRPIKRSLDLISRATRSPADARAWLNDPHPALGERTPLEVILSGRSGAIVTLLENLRAGIPS